MKSKKPRQTTPESDKRAVGRVTVLKPEDLLAYSTLNERVNALVENRCEVFIHNVEFLRKRHNLSQSKLCDEKLEGLLKSPVLTAYKSRGKEIPLRPMALVAAAFGLTVEDMCGQLLDEKASALPDETDAPVGRPREEYEKYAGTYDLAYFDSSKPLGENLTPTADALNNAVMTIYTTYNAIGMASYHVAAIFNCTDEEREKIAGLMTDLDLTKDSKEVRTRYESVVAFPNPITNALPRMKCLYEGSIHLTEQMTELTLHQVRGNDTVHLLLHNRAATSSDGKPYKGGLATMMSMSRGAEHMPCIQAALMLREMEPVPAKENENVNHIPKSRFDYFAKEYIAQKLYLAPPKIDLGQEIEDIVSYMRFLFSQKGEQPSITSLSFEDKSFCLETFAEKKLTEALRRNILSYYKVAVQMDSEIYQMTRIH